MQVRQMKALPSAPHMANLDEPQHAPVALSTAPAPSRSRDLRLDFFRGLALLFIFLDHIPFNFMSWLTIHNYGFSDAAEIFIFISGYSAALSYGRALRSSGFWAAAARILRRCWQLYVAQIFLLVLFTAQVAFIVLRFDNDFFAEEMQVIGLFQNLPETLVQALLLKYRPAFFDILPLYIVLLLAFPFLLWALERWPLPTCAAAALVYGWVQVTHVNFPAYPPGLKWNFNPLAWQFLFLLGAAVGRRPDRSAPLVPRRPLLLGIAGGFLVLACLASVLSLLLAPEALPGWLSALPVAKPDLPPLRLIHFFALAYVTVALIGERPVWLGWRIATPVIQCGQQSLPVFCAGILLSLAAHMILVMVSDTVLMHVVVSVAGIALLLGYGSLLGWFRRTEKTGPVSHPELVRKPERMAGTDAWTPVALAGRMPPAEDRTRAQPPPPPPSPAPVHAWCVRPDGRSRPQGRAN